jgi:hypothetical protein
MQSVVTSPKIETKFYSIEIDVEGFVVVNVIPGVLEVEATIGFIDELISNVDLITSGIPHPILFIWGSTFVKLSHEARSYIVKNEKINYLKKAEAIVTDSLPSRLIVNFYFNFHKPPVPAKLFADENKARKWLAQFK